MAASRFVSFLVGLAGGENAIPPSGIPSGGHKLPDFRHGENLAFGGIIFGEALQRGGGAGQ